MPLIRRNYRLVRDFKGMYVVKISYYIYKNPKFLKKILPNLEISFAPNIQNSERLR